MKTSGRDTLMAMVKRSRKGRDQLMVLLVGTLGLSADALRTLTIADAVQELKAARGSRVPEDLILGATKALGIYKKSYDLNKDSLVFTNMNSKRSRGRLSRTTVWRILSKAAKSVFGQSVPGALRVLQGVRAVLHGGRAAWHLDALTKTSEWPAWGETNENAFWSQQEPQLV